MRLYRKVGAVAPLLNSLTVVRPELSGLVHVLADHFNVEDGLAVSGNKIHSKPAARSGVWKHPLYFHIVVIIFYL